MKTLLHLVALFLLVSNAAFSQESKPTVQEGKGDVGSTWKSIYKALQDVDTRYYKIQVLRRRNPETVGNAELGRLQMVSVFGARESSFETKNLIEVKAKGSSSRDMEYIKLIWTMEAISDIKDKVEEVNNLLKKANTSN